MYLICDMCGSDFQAKNRYEKYCKECRYKRLTKTVLKQPEPIKSTTQKIIETVREAEKLGLTYGKYKGRNIK